MTANGGVEVKTGDVLMFGLTAMFVITVLSVSDDDVSVMWLCDSDFPPCRVGLVERWRGVGPNMPEWRVVSLDELTL